MRPSAGMDKEGPAQRAWQQFWIPFGPYGFVLPALLLMGIATFWPMLQALYLSLTRYDLLSTPTWIGLENYRRLLWDPLFWKALGNTLLYVALVVPPLVWLPLGLAILVNRPWPGIGLFRLLYYLPVVFSVVVAGLAWRWLYAENGLLNHILSLVLGHAVRIPWLTDPRWALFSVSLVTIWKGLGYYMVIYLAGLQGIPTHLYEAAALDGANRWQQHRWITLPLMRPYQVLVLILSTIAAMKVFEEVYLLTRGGPVYSTLTLVYYLYERGIRDLEMGYASAMGLVLFGVVLLLSLGAVRLYSSREEGL
ncbi:sugar ABC transporter permease [Synechococcus bigranulatus str. 'Rupite']|uniref:Sugar ABC transporter permease n=2 Tax=Thermostichus vulcanus TaxID=32053 RepID=A0ABT0CEJ1_THEVL|nr:sugar ABC transporter permease [Thermostichus vulcanus]MCJ2544186.1 sugar ABC transporter permease [Thermostichus vulcanus str. 'Rupite']